MNTVGKISILSNKHKTPTDFYGLLGLIIWLLRRNYVFWTVEDTSPYKEKSNFLMRSPLCRGAFGLLKSSVVEQSGDENDEAGACVVNQCARGGIQHAEDGKGHGQDVDHHGEGDARLDGARGGDGQPL